MTESKKHKAKRIVVFAFLGFLVAILGVAAAAGTTQAAAGVQHHSTVLQSESVIIEDWGHNPVNGTYQELPISSTNGTTTVFNDFTVTHKSGNTTNVTTDYYAPDYLLTNVTVNQMNVYAVNNISITTSMGGNVTATIGYGSSYRDFTPIASTSASVKGNSTFSYQIMPSELTGNQSSYLMIEFGFGKNTNFGSYTVFTTIRGVPSTDINYVTGEDVGYAITGTLLFAFGFLAVPHYDTSLVIPEKSIGKTGTNARMAQRFHKGRDSRRSYKRSNRRR